MEFLPLVKTRAQLDMVAKRNHHTPSKSFCELNKVVRILQTVDQRHTAYHCVHFRLLDNVLKCTFKRLLLPNGKIYHKSHNLSINVVEDLDYLPSFHNCNSNEQILWRENSIYCHLKYSLFNFTLFVKILSQKFGKFLF